MCNVLLGGMGGVQRTPLGASPLVPWLLVPPQQHGAGGAAQRLRKIKSFSEGRGDTRTPVIGNTSATAWKVIFAT